VCRAADAIRAAAAGSARTRLIAVASAAGSRGATSTPFTPSFTRSAVPPTRVATTGRPAAIASMSTELRSS
jgi:hypothetical protein